METPNKAKYYDREELNVEPIREIAQEVLSEVSRVIVGYGDILQQLFIALLVNGHVLLEGVPGLGKTVMAKTFATTLGISFRRVQFTPDLLPADITGTKIFDQNEGAFVLQKGPLFANVVLADEINRSAPKTQAALLEAMAERQITIEGETLPLEKPFMVVATENPVEMEGTYPLPEAQLDRFIMKLWLEYPEKEEEVDIMRRQISGESPSVEAITSGEELLAAQKLMNMVYIDDRILNLQPGELVEVKSREEILATLDDNRKYKGMYWMCNMWKFCGKKFRVYKRLERILLESNGEYRNVKNTVLLEGVVCDGLEFYDCDRSCFHFWKEAWLRRVNE